VPVESRYIESELPIVRPRIQLPVTAVRGLSERAEPLVGSIPENEVRGKFLIASIKLPEGDTARQASGTPCSRTSPTLASGFIFRIYFQGLF
jgi:hypothetical protein